jgi:hypothetical protein
VSPRREWMALATIGVLLIAAGCSRRASSDQVKVWDAEIRSLQAEQDSLRAVAQVHVERDPRLRELPQGDVVVSVPTSFVRDMIGRVLHDVADDVTLSLGGLKAHVVRSVKKVITIGEFTLDVDILEVSGRLATGEPAIDFGGNQVSLSMPVTVTEGHGEASIHFVWDGKNVAGATCGDMDITQKVSGSVIPSEYVVSGTLNLETRGSEIVCTPLFPETKLRIRLKPSQGSWDAVNAILAEKHGVCGWVLDKVNVPGLLEGIVQEKGFNVKLPVNRIRPFVLPAGVQDSVAVGGKLFTFDTRTKSLRIDSDAIWYSADVAVKLQ